MPRRPGQPGRPVDHFEGEFPNGTVADSAPPGTAEMARVALGLAEHLRTEPVATFARRAGVDRSTIYAVLAGRVFIDAVTLARLEHAVGHRLWPGPDVEAVQADLPHEHRGRRSAGST